MSPSLRTRIERAWTAAYDLGGLLPYALMRHVDPRGSWARAHLQVTRWIREFGVRRTSMVVDSRYDATQLDTTILRAGPLEVEVADLAGTRVYRIWVGSEEHLFVSESVNETLWRALEATVGRLEDRAREAERERTEPRSYGPPDWDFDFDDDRRLDG